MTDVFRPHEAEVIRRLAMGRLDPELVGSVLAGGCLQSVEHTGGGYFLTVSHPRLPAERMVLDQPALSGTAGGFSCGFVIFIENGVLTLECHAWGAEDLPGNIREQDFAIAPVA